MAFAVAQSLVGLFAAGSLFATAHALFLKFYEREWTGVQAVGPNDCQGMERIANADLIGGTTFCNRPQNFVPWTMIYERHPWAAVAYYGAAALLLIGLALIWRFVANRRPRPTPFGSSVPTTKTEHLR